MDAETIEFIRLVRAMRDAQKRYERWLLITDLEKKRRLEFDVDAAIKRLSQSQGQGELFTEAK